MADVSRSTALFEQIESALTTVLRDRPVLTIFGEHNDPLGFQNRWTALFLTGRRIVVPRGNHVPMNDDPHRFATAIRIRSCSATGRHWQDRHARRSPGC